jgi:hypothetical protein
METLNDKLARLEKEIVELKKLPVAVPPVDYKAIYLYIDKKSAQNKVIVDYKAIDSAIKKQIKEAVTIDYINNLYRETK